jgi:hypothetical protein
VNTQFGITAGNVPEPGTQLPNYIQFRNHGTDLGLPDATILDFGNNLTATRGTGENANKVTVTAAGGGGGGGLPQPWVGKFEVADSEIEFGAFTQFNEWDTVTQLVASDEFEIVGTALHILVAGLYEVKIGAYVQPNSGAQWGPIFTS